ncbi:TonB-dependent receptor [Paraglaciecola sp. MB-3u-78]|uniref:TonB-dependent receptor n=1 Tax=Paraglaciecola sp. MB-3u-78 TaxID=2058332 RepID=UPI000C34FBBC|nr:TonB-dependent receptor [Paraglaciecola sp. MB-3u-78]PKG97246.1 TonB-dependent receptor [Paraglaciecola sp. MB-3u-78]
MSKTTFKLKSLAIAVAVSNLAALSANAQERAIEKIVVTAEKRGESLQDLSQAVTALTAKDLDKKYISSFVDLSAIAPGVTVAKNEGFKTIISIRGVGNEANQNATANPSVSYHMDGIYIASPYALQTDFIDIERIEILRGPQGTLFGQNSTGGAINVISAKPNFAEFSGKADVSLGTDNLVKVRGTVNVPISDDLAMRTSFSRATQDGYTQNVYNGPNVLNPSETFVGEDMDNIDNLSMRTDWLWNASDTLSLRFLAQYFSGESNGAGIKGIDDPTPGARNLSQDTDSSYELESQVYGLIAEWDAGFAVIKSLSSYQKDDITVVRDNDRHSFDTNPEIQISVFNPEINIQTTFTQELNVISKEPLFGKLDWIVGAFYLDTDIEITIREELDVGRDGVLDGYVPSFPAVFGGDRGFISDSNPQRESLSFYGQTTYPLSESVRLITGLRYTKDEVESTVSNFFGPSAFINPKTEDLTGRIAMEWDAGDDTMTYASYTRGLKPGGSNLTFSEGDAALVRASFEDETIDAYELGLKTEFMDSRVRTNVAAFYYDYTNLQFQASDFNEFGSGVSNIPESEIYGVELEMTALIGDRFSLDVKLASMQSEVSADYLALDNRLLIEDVFLADGLTPAKEEIHGASRDVARFLQNLSGNELAKTPGLTADISLGFEDQMKDGAYIGASLQYTYRGEFEQRVFNNAEVDTVDSYDLINLTVSYDNPDEVWGVDLIAYNMLDEDGVNSAMTDVFGVNETGFQYVAPRQLMARFRYSF